MNQHYFSATPSSDYTPQEIEVQLAGRELTLVTAGGVFSPEHVDQGTQALLNTVDEVSEVEVSGPILDIGCGWGPIALHAALTHPEREIWAIDVNERSLDLTRQNASRLGLTNVRAVIPDEVPEDLLFAEIRSNPPIRVGKEVLHSILRTWLPRVQPGGAAFLVVAKHLGADSLQRWLGTEFAELTVERAARKKGFHVLAAYRPDGSPEE